MWNQNQHEFMVGNYDLFPENYDHKYYEYPVFQ